MSKFEGVHEKYQPFFDLIGKRDRGDSIKIACIGGMGAGKSRFVSAVHKTLRQSNAGLKISKGKIGDYCRREKRVLALERRRWDVYRSNATLEPDILEYYGVADKGSVVFRLYAPGGHTSADKLNFIPEGIVYIIDSSLSDYLASNYFTNGKVDSKKVYWLDEDTNFKQDKLDHILESVLWSYKYLIESKAEQIPTIGCITHKLADNLSAEDLADKIENTYNQIIGAACTDKIGSFWTIPREEMIRLDFSWISSWYCVDSELNNRYIDVLYPLYEISKMSLEKKLRDNQQQMKSVDPQELKLVNFSELWEGPKNNNSITIRYNQIT